MLVDQLELPIPFEKNGKLVEADDVTLQHHAIDEEQRHRRAFLRGSGKEDVLEAGALPARLPRSPLRSSVGARCGMIVEIACL